MTPSSQVAGVLLAAGRSTRMGQPKPLAQLGGRPLCAHAASALAAAGVWPRLVVVPPGPVGEQIAAVCAGQGFAAVVNPDPARGLASSFRRAAQALMDGAQAGGQAGGAALFALADMPFVSADTHGAVVQAFARTQAPLVLTAYGEGEAAIHAPPHLFRADLWPELAALPDADTGPRQLLRRLHTQAVTVTRPVAELLDLDTPEALAAAEARWGRGQEL